MFDEAEILPEPPRPRWPLHPRPRSFEQIDDYVRRLAECYETGLGTFCHHALGLTLEAWVGCKGDPPTAVLERLSAGTGVAVWRLRDMNPRRSYARIMISLRNFVRDYPGQLPLAPAEALQQTPV